jgi:MSHA biogenesis protein MshG
MARFAYVARGPGGDRIEGVLEMPDARSAAAALIERGATPLSIVPPPAGAAGGGAGAGASSVGVDDALAAHARLARGAARALPGRRGARIEPMELQLFTRELHALVRAGIPIMRALDILRESNANPALAAVIGRVRGHLDAGVDLAEAFEREAATSRGARLFSRYYVSILRVGSTTGRLEECLLQLSRYLEFQRATREQVAAALRYPGFVVAAALIALGIVNVFVLPEFEKAFRGMGTSLPPLTRALMAGSRFTVQAWPVLLAGTVLSALGARAWLRTAAGRHAAAGWMLALPIVGDTIRRACLSRLAHALALSMRSGVPLVQGLEVVATTVGNARYEAAVLAIRDRVARGESMRAAAAATGMFPPAMLQMIAVGEETGSLDELLDELAGFYRSEVEWAISRLSARLEPVLILGLGAAILVLALGVFLPMWELGGAALGRGR